MRWRKLGLVRWPARGLPWAQSHMTIPTPVLREDGSIRVYVNCLDAQGRGRPAYVDLDARDPTRIVRAAQTPLLDLGTPGSFDDNGVVCTSLVSSSAGLAYMYYVGFEICSQVRYRLFTGLAVSRDGGETFIRHSRSPVLDRTDEELLFRCGPFVRFEDGKFRLWYVAGSEWADVQGKALPVYDLRYQESDDGIRWSPRGTVSLALSDPDEHGFGRPWVVRRGPQDYQLFYSIRRRSCGAYRLGYAQSTDGLHWHRLDAEMGLDVSPAGFDSEAIMYSAVLEAGGRTLCFYNGSGFGADGFGVAELVEP